MKKICFVIQRYGLEVNGGAELHCRLLAEHMTDRYDISVMTTKAKDHMTWKNEYETDEEEIHGVHVYRFANEKERDQKYFAKEFNTYERSSVGDPEMDERFLLAQGPYCPQLIKAIREKKDEFDAFVFYTYLYYPTIKGIPEVREKALFVPTAHDEPFIHMSYMNSIFNEVQGILYLTDVEEKLCNRLFNNESVNSRIGGVGIDDLDAADEKDIKAKYGLSDYIVYVGRVEGGKMCNVLLDYFQEYKKRNSSNLQLIFAGKVAQDIRIPARDDIKALGFVSDQDKINLEKNAVALCLPSRYESLSMVVLEAMKLRVPVIINGDCEVVRSHCIRSNGGLYYHNYFEFEGILNWMKEHPEECRLMGENGKRYVDTYYTWKAITNSLSELIEGIGVK